MVVERQFEDVWAQLRAKKPHVGHFLDIVRIDGLRGIRGLMVNFSYPVSVIAGPNASGKSTVLFALACAYKVPGATPHENKPSTLFPGYYPAREESAAQDSVCRDTRDAVSLEYEYSLPQGGRRSMAWRYQRNWNRSYFGRTGASQPERPVYLRTLSSMSNPSEVRGVLRLAFQSTPPDEVRLTAAQIAFAQSILVWDYSEVIRITDQNREQRNLLFAKRDVDTAYSEFQMAAGERSVLRLALEIAQLRDALVLIDELETGLHPTTQRMLMLHLQRLALRNNLQIILTTHSLVVLNTVPPEARVFLDRESDGTVRVREPLRDLLQNALYGSVRSALNLLCEDSIAEAILRGIIDYLAPKENIDQETTRVGRDTGAEQFNSHAQMAAKFGMLDDFVFVLDGDQRGGAAYKKLCETVDRKETILFLPGKGRS